MANKELDVLGQMIMEGVRDESISDIRMVFSGAMKGTDADEIRDKLKALAPGDLKAVEAIIPNLVDQVIHNFLYSVEQSDEVELMVDGATEVRASEESDGLSGELYGSNGWIERFSKTT